MATEVVTFGGIGTPRSGAWVRGVLGIPSVMETDRCEWLLLSKGCVLVIVAVRADVAVPFLVRVGAGIVRDGLPVTKDTLTEIVGVIGGAASHLGPLNSFGLTQ